MSAGSRVASATQAASPDVVGDLILNDEERAFVNACWIATAWRREDARPAAEWHGRDGLPEAPDGS